MTMSIVVYQGREGSQSTRRHCFDISEVDPTIQMQAPTNSLIFALGKEQSIPQGVTINATKTFPQYVSPPPIVANNIFPTINATKAANKIGPGPILLINTPLVNAAIAPEMATGIIRSVTPHGVMP